MFFDDTIAAISTPIGKAAISVIRISGPDAAAVAGQVFKPLKCPLENLPPRYAAYGKFYAGGKIIDDGIAVLYRAPSSFTGQDMVELSCHGGMLVTQCILEQLLLAGARLAEPGEFTRRAYCLGKLDLSQAEAIALTLEAKNRAALAVGAAQREGILSGKIKDIFDEITDIVASVYVDFDFPDEDLSDVGPDELKSRLLDISDKLHALLASYTTGRAVTEGIPTTICGKPNSGKSSLLNRLLGTERAIVTDIAGTTRDTIEETAVVGNVTLRLCDTAGIRETDDAVEKIGISRAISAAQSAELILAVFDGSVPLDGDDEKILTLVSEWSAAGKKIIAVINKADLPQKLTEGDVTSRADFDAALRVSAALGDGFDKLADIISSLYIDGSLDFGSDAILTGARQYSAVEGALHRIESAIAALEEGMTADIVGLDLEEALKKLGELDGRSVSEEVVDSIFRNFCVGK